MQTTNHKYTPADITPAIKTAAAAVLMARAIAEVERERMDKLDRELLAEIPCHVSQKIIDLHDKHGDTEAVAKWEACGRRITNLKDAFLMDDDDAKVYYAERQRRINAMGYQLPDGHCPALVAENTQRDAEHCLVECAQEVFGVTFDQLLSSGLDTLHKYIDLLVKLVVNLPDFKNPLTQKAP